jgi:ferredoxin-NADP reductase
MRKLSHILECRFAATALSSVFLCLTAQAQTSPKDHAAHHPDQNANAPMATPTPGQPPGNQPAQGGMPMQGGQTGMPPAGKSGAMTDGGMGEMMDGMGAPPRKELYPSLMALPAEVTPEERAEIEQLAQERMKAGAALLSSGLEKLSDSTSDEDYAATQHATAEMREGLAQVEAGLAARRVLSEGKAPRTLALTWFKREMNLTSPIRPDEPRTVLGVTPFHLFTMVLLIAFALAMVAMYFFKMRRAAALFGRLGPDTNPPPGAAPPLAGAPGPSTPVAPPPGGAPAPAAPTSPATPAAGTPAAAVPSPGGPSAVHVAGGDDANAADTPPALPGARGSPGSPAALPVAPGGADVAKIADRADELWRARGRPMGSPEIDWSRAEEELAKAADTPPVPSAGGGSSASPATPPAVSDAIQASAVAANWRGQLCVGSIVTETPSVKTFRLLPSSGDRVLPFTFVPGQFLNVAFWIGGARMNRSYTISSSPTEREYVELTVRREPRGAVSRHIVDLLKVGDQINAGGPVGRFTFTGTEADSIVLIAGGVGITPMMSITRYLTEQSWAGDIFFLYTCRTPTDFIFADDVAALERRNPRLRVAVTISGAEGTDWKGARGRITKEWLTQTVPDLASRRIHLCGPPSMMDAIKALLAELGVPPDRLKTEAFGTPKPPPAAAGVTAKPTAPATGPLVTFSKNNKTAKIHVGQTILELSEELSIGIEYSCRVGTCGVCKVKMTSGEVEMAVEDALEPDDKANGIILACQAKPTSEVAVEA